MYGQPTVGDSTLVKKTSVLPRKVPRFTPQQMADIAASQSVKKSGVSLQEQAAPTYQPDVAKVEEPSTAASWLGKLDTYTPGKFNETRPANQPFSSQEIAHMSIAGVDLAATLAGLVPGLNVGAAAVGAGASLADAGVSLTEAKDSWDVARTAGGLAMNLGLDAFSLVPGGKLAKATKIVKGVRPWLVRAAAVSGAVGNTKETVSLLAKVNKGEYTTITPNEWSAAANLLQFAVGTGRNSFVKKNAGKAQLPTAKVPIEEPKTEWFPRKVEEFQAFDKRISNKLDNWQTKQADKFASAGKEPAVKKKNEDSYWNSRVKKKPPVVPPVAAPTTGAVPPVAPTTAPLTPVTTPLVAAASTTTASPPTGTVIPSKTASTSKPNYTPASIVITPTEKSRFMASVLKAEGKKISIPEVEHRIIMRNNPGEFHRAKQHLATTLKRKIENEEVTDLILKGIIPSKKLGGIVHFASGGRVRKFIYGGEDPYGLLAKQPANSMDRYNQFSTGAGLTHTDRSATDALYGAGMGNFGTSLTKRLNPRNSGAYQPISTARYGINSVQQTPYRLPVNNNITKRINGQQPLATNPTTIDGANPTPVGQKISRGIDGLMDFVPLLFARKASNRGIEMQDNVVRPAVLADTRGQEQNLATEARVASLPQTSDAATNIIQKKAINSQLAGQINQVNQAKSQDYNQQLDRVAQEQNANIQQRNQVNAQNTQSANQISNQNAQVKSAMLSSVFSNVAARRQGNQNERIQYGNNVRTLQAQDEMGNNQNELDLLRMQHGAETDPIKKAQIEAEYQKKLNFSRANMYQKYNPQKHGGVIKHKGGGQLTYGEQLSLDNNQMAGQRDRDLKQTALRFTQLAMQATAQSLNTATRIILQATDRRLSQIQRRQ